MNSKQDRETTKKPYEKPRLRAIELAAEEVLGVGCKVASGGGGPTAPTCLNDPCVLEGS